MTKPELTAVCVGGISFTAEGAQKTRDGLKTHTMRVMEIECSALSDANMRIQAGRDGIFCNGCIEAEESSLFCVAKPKYKPGDILYVREPWAKRCCLLCSGIRLCDTHTFDGSQVVCPDGRVMDDDDDGCTLYGSMGIVPRALHPADNDWQPSKTMPIEAARSFIRITGVEATRPRGLTKEGIIAEGLPQNFDYCKEDTSFDCYRCKRIGLCVELHDDCNLRREWLQLFRSIYPPEQHGDNPWCWGYRYERVVPDA